MTIICAFLGFLVFIVSCFTVRFKQAFKRWMMFIGVGFIIDVLIVLTSATFTYGHLY
jgi:hypothetical protein